jgi:NADH-quinone oxidoreductase subunit H
MMGFLAMYTKLYVMSALMTVLFLGGWSGPGLLPQPVWFLLKTFLVATVIVVIRGTFPRVRVDILLRTGWTRLLLLALANIFVTVALISLGLDWVWRI